MNVTAILALLIHLLITPNKYQGDICFSGGSDGFCKLCCFFLLLRYSPLHKLPVQLLEPGPRPEVPV